ncbi:MAG: HAMP domain-containing sensor histidine kinase [Bacteroidota bacterium]
MTNQVKGVIALIICSLMGMFYLQSYYAWQVYQQHSLALQGEIDEVLLAAVSKAQEEKNLRIKERVDESLRNPELVSYAFLRTAEGPKIATIDPITGETYSSLTYPGEAEPEPSLKEMQEYLIKRNDAFMAKGTYMYWSPLIAERLEDYMKNTRLSAAFLNQQFEKELKSRNIEGGFRVLFTSEEFEDEDFAQGELRSLAWNVHTEEYDHLALVISNPAFEILKRMGLILGSTVLVLMLIVLSFGALGIILHRQKKLSALKDDFIDNVTHELLTPLATLKLALETLNRDPDFSQSPYLEISNQQTHRMAEVVDHILQVSFVEEGKAGLRMESVELVGLIQEVANYHRTMAQKPIALSLELPSEILVWSDHHHLNNVLHNISGNAVKYGPAKGAEIGINLKTEGDILLLQIWDNGRGIPAEEQEAIFDKFHRVQRGGIHDVKGLGIGLYYSRSILRQLGGDIRLAQSSAAGSCFEITLPLIHTAVI